LDDLLVCRIPSCIPEGHPHTVTNTRRRNDAVISPDDGHTDNSMDVGLIINEKKTKYLKSTKKETRNESLTLRVLMSYIYMEHPFLMFLDHTQRRSTVGRTPLDE